MCKKSFITLLSSIILIIFTFSVSSADILVLAPHPDDDVIMASGVIYRALQNSEAVRVVYMTNGDYQGLHAGRLRPVEAVNGQARLGMDENNLIAL